jgi:hypothetical protein
MSDARPPTFVVPVGDVPDVGTVDAVARTCLGLRRLGGRVRVVAPPCLLELLELAGIDEAVELVAGYERTAAVQLLADDPP